MLEHKLHRTINLVQNAFETGHHRLLLRGILQLELIVAEDSSHHNFGFMHGEKPTRTSLGTIPKYEVVRCDGDGLHVISEQYEPRPEWNYTYLVLLLVTRL